MNTEVIPSRNSLEKRKAGFYNSTTIAKSPEEVFIFCQRQETIEKALTNLPLGVENFLELILVCHELKAPDLYEIRFQNSPRASVTGSLTFYIKKGPSSRGSILYTVAEFKEFRAKDEEPSDLINLFLRRLKSLIETGVLATTRGQPSGRDELESVH